MLADEVQNKFTFASGLRDALESVRLQKASVLKKCDSTDDDSFDDGVSTCAPSSVGSSSVDSTPDLAPMAGPCADMDTFLALLPLHKDAPVCVIHHDEMQLHVPPRDRTIYELPRRVIAIENCLKGLPTSSGFSKRSWGNAPMQFLRSSRGKSKNLVMAFGSQAAKKRRTSYSSGPALAGSVWDACLIVEAPVAQNADLRLVHSKRHIDQVTDLCGMAKSENSAFFPLIAASTRAPATSKGLLNDDIYFAPNSLTAMKRAAGGAVEAVRRLFSVDPASGRATARSDVESSFAIVRPPGHHCCTEPNGFCFFNNTAIAAAHARKVLGLPRVAIVDWDYHHGDGQQTSFYQDPTVLTISLHVAMERNKKGKDMMAFPQNQGMNLTRNGRGEGEGYNINIPWPHDKVGVVEYEEAFRSVVLPALQGFDPDLILVASGFDAVKGDTLSGTLLPPRSYYDMTRHLLSLKKPVAVILEGGYSPELLAQGSLNVTHALLGRRPPCEDGAAPYNVNAESKSVGHMDLEAAGVLNAVRRRLNSLPPWRMMQCGSDHFFNEDSSPGSAAGLQIAHKLSERIEEIGRPSKE